MLNSLHDIRLPTEAAGGALAEIAAVIGVAALLAGLLLAVTRLLGMQRVRERAPDLAERLVALEGTTESARRVALLHLLKEHDRARFAQLAEGQGLYRPGGVALENIEREVRRCV